MNINSVMFGGNLTQDVEFKMTAQNSPVAKFRLACNRGQDNVTFMQVAAFDKTAGLLQESFNRGGLRKGGRLIVEGYITTNEYTDQAGVKKISTAITATRVHFVDALPNQAPQYNQPAAQQPHYQQQQQQPYSGYQQPGYQMPPQQQAQPPRYQQQPPAGYQQPAPAYNQNNRAPAASLPQQNPYGATPPPPGYARPAQSPYTQQPSYQQPLPGAGVPRDDNDVPF